MTILVTPRFRLRPFREDDLARLVEAMADWEVAQWLDTPPYPYEEKDGLAWMARVEADHADGRPRNFAVAERESDRLLGCVSLADEGSVPNFGYWYHPDAWGRGCATEACRAFLDYVRDELAMARIGSRIDPDNLASQRVLEKLGFARTGRATIDRPTRRGAPWAEGFELCFDVGRPD